MNIVTLHTTLTITIKLIIIIMEFHAIIECTGTHKNNFNIDGSM